MPPEKPRARVWRSYGDDPLPSAEEALARPLWAFPSWFLRIECDRCGKDRMLQEMHASDRQREMPIRVLLARARHDGCGGRAGRVELLTVRGGSGNEERFSLSGAAPDLSARAPRRDPRR